MGSLGVLLSEKGDLDGAEPLYRRALEAREQKLGPEHPDTLTSMNNLGLLLMDKGDLTAAHAAFKRCAAGWSDPSDWKHHWARLGLALCEGLETGDFAAAEGVVSDLVALLGAGHDRIEKAETRLDEARRQRADNQEA